MLAVCPTTPETLAAGPPRLVELPDPIPGPGEVVLAVRATALNRADLLQLRGHYPPPPGESEIPGLECAGVVEAVGSGVESLREGDRVMALLAGGGHATRVVVPSGQTMPIPDGLGFADAAALPEVALTAWTNLVHEGGLEAGETVLIVAAASGVGTFAVQLARELGARVVVAGRSRARLEALRPLGADLCLELGGGSAEDAAGFVERLRADVPGGVELVIDLAGGEPLGPRLGALATRGRYVLVGVLAGSRATLDLRDVLSRRLRLIGSVLRARSREEKARLVEGFHAFAAERLRDGRLRPVVDRTLPFEQILDAYEQMRAGGHLGKIVLTMD
ncbi:MAG: NAD(P)H-quinone oxidoreductase [Acidobacteriota bacterium]